MQPTRTLAPVACPPRRLRTLALLLAALGFTGVAACSAASDDVDGVTASSDGEDALTVRVREDGATVSVNADVAFRRESNGEAVATLRGSTSYALREAFSFVPDDAFGTARVTGPKSFAIELRGGHEINSIASGLPLRVRFVTTSGRTFFASIELAPAFSRFAGSRDVFVSQAAAPTFVRDGITNLRYRAVVQAPGATALQATIGGVDVTGASAGGGTFNVDLGYEALEAALSAGGASRFAATTATGTAQKAARLGLTVTTVQVTAGDPETVWPIPECRRDVFQCIQAAPASTTDLSVCGAYRDVARCAYADACEVFGGSLPYALEARDASPLTQPVADADRACPRNAGSWCSVGPVSAFSYPYCVEEPPSEDSVFTDAVQASDREGYYDVRFFDALTRAQLLERKLLSPSLLARFDAFAGDVNVVARRYVNPEPCHNCSQFGTKLVLYYPNLRTVIVLDGSFGYDS
jgi:hypothetical protein